MPSARITAGVPDVRAVGRAAAADKPRAGLDRNRVVLPAVFAEADADQSVPLHPVLRAALEGRPG